MPLRDHIKERIQKSAGPSVSITNAGLSDADVGEIVILVNANPKITNLDLNCNNIRNEGIKNLTSLLHLNTLKVSQNNFGDEAAIALVSASQFISLDLSRNRAITDTTGQFILNKAHQITLKIDGTDISDKLCEQISERIKNNLKNYHDNMKKNSEKKKPEMKHSEIIEEKTATTSSKGFFSKTTVQTEQTDHLSENKKYSPPSSLTNNTASK